MSFYSKMYQLRQDGYTPAVRGDSRYWLHPTLNQVEVLSLIHGDGRGEYVATLTFKQVEEMYNKMLYRDFQK